MEHNLEPEKLERNNQPTVERGPECAKYSKSFPHSSCVIKSEGLEEPEYAVPIRCTAYKNRMNKSSESDLLDSHVLLRMENHLPLRDVFEVIEKPDFTLTKHQDLSHLDLSEAADCDSDEVNASTSYRADLRYQGTFTNLPDAQLPQSYLTHVTSNFRSSDYAVPFRSVKTAPKNTEEEVSSVNVTPEVLPESFPTAEILRPIIDDQGYAIPKSLFGVTGEKVCRCSPRQDFVEWHYKTTKSVIRKLKSSASSSSIVSNESWCLNDFLDCDDASCHSFEEYLILDSPSDDNCSYKHRQGVSRQKAASSKRSGSQKSSDATTRAKARMLPDTLTDICIKFMMKNVTGV